MRTEEILCAGLHAGPVQVLRHQNRRASINNTGPAKWPPSLQLQKIKKLVKLPLYLTEIWQKKQQLLQIYKALDTKKVFRLKAVYSLSQMSMLASAMQQADELCCQHTQGTTHELSKSNISKHFTGHLKTMAIISHSTLKQHILPALQ